MREGENRPASGGGFGTGGLVVLVVGAGVGAYFLHDYFEEQKRKDVLKYQQEQDYNFSPVVVNGKKLSNWANLAGQKITNANLATIASDLYGALHPGWYVPTEQDRVVRVFKQTPAGMVKKLETVYLKIYDEDLKKVLTEKLSDVNFIKIKNFFSGKLYQWPGLYGA